MLSLLTLVQGCTIVIGLLTLNSSLYAQGNVGVNVLVPDPSSILDVAANNLGLLIPRMALTSTTSPLPVTAPAVSLLVYNTATAGVSPNNVTPGYYYWDGTKWNGIGGDAWRLTGNAGTTAGTNFIGTTDANAFIVKTNNTKRITVDTAYTLVLRNLTVKDTVRRGNTAFASVSYTYHPLAPSPDFVRHNQFLSSKRVPSGLTDNGYSIGMWLQNFRGLNDNNFLQNINDDDGGTLTQLVGLNLQYGHHSYGKVFPSMASATTTDAFGITVDGLAVYGTITNAYDIYLGSTVASTNHFGIYSAGAAKKSYFAGSVGIGTTTPAQKLTIENGEIQLGEAMPVTGLGHKLIFSDAFNNTDAIYFQRENSSLDVSDLNLIIGDNFGNAGVGDKFNIKCTNSLTVPIFTAQASGMVGIGVAVPAYRLDVFGSVGSALGFTTYSDKYYKKNIQTLNPTLANVLKLRPITYLINYDADTLLAKMLNKDYTQQIGLIAQETQAIFPQIVTQNTNGKLGIDYSKLGPILVQAVQELNTKIDTKQNSINTLQTQVQELSRKLDEQGKLLQQVLQNYK